MNSLTPLKPLRVLAAAATLTVGLWATDANAATIIGNLPTTPAGSTTKIAITAGGQFMGFTMGDTDYQLTSLTLTLLSEESEIDESCSVGLYSNVAGAPGPLLVGFGNVIVIHNVPFAEYTLNPLAPFTLEADLTYWIGLVDDNSSPVGAPYWMASTPPVEPTGSAASHFGSVGTSNQNVSYRLEGTAVPEPGATALAGFGVLAGMLKRRRRDA